MLKIYYLCSEINPFSAASSIGSFSKEFSTILKNNKEIDIRLTQPKYGYISDRRFILREVIRLKDLSINFQGGNNIINLKSGFIPNTRVQVYFMEHEKYFKKTSELLYKSRNGRFYSDNSEKFTFFVKAAIETLEKLYWIPDYIICNNWQMSMLPIIFKTLYKNEFKKTKVVFMIHEINDFYNFESSIYEKLNLEYNKKHKLQNNLISGIQNSDYVFFFNNNDSDLSNYINKNKEIKKSLSKVKHKIIDYSPSLDNSERIKVYNDILKTLK